jgi:hypothetical protein
VVPLPDPSPARELALGGAHRRRAVWANGAVSMCARHGFTPASGSFSSFPHGVHDAAGGDEGKADGRSAICVLYFVRVRVPVYFSDPRSVIGFFALTLLGFRS